MAQTGYTPISIYYSATSTNVPTAGNLVAGELAINTADGKLFYKDSAGVVQVIGTKGGVGSSTTGQVLYNSSGLVVGSANMTFNGTVLASTYVLAGTGSTVGSAVLQANGGVSVLNGNNQYFWNSGNTTAPYIANPSNSLSFYTNSGTEAMRIDSGGKVGIGTTSLSARFTVSNSESADVATFNATGTTTNYGVAIVSYATAANTSALIRGFSGTSPSQVFNLNGAGNIDSFGGQITFPATQSASSNANTLDDYEEGTWTPTDVSGAGLTFSIAKGYYTKIGNVVTAYFRVNYPGTASTAGAQIGGLPFAVTAGYDGANSGTIIRYTSYANAFTMPPNNSSTAMSVYLFGGTQVLNVNLSGQRIDAVAVYQTNT
jgi:hypothetical protein